MDFLMCLGFTTKSKFKCKQNHHHQVNDETSVDKIINDHQPHESEIKMIRKFSWDEIARSTNFFSTLIGSGGFSNVYLGTAPIHDQHHHHHHHQHLAIKIQNNISRVFKQELDILLHLHHDNIVKLLGYCDDIEREVGALVFEYVSNGSLQDKLHGDGSVIPWKNRMAIAFQVAQAIEYLHDKCALQIVHGDIKASNIILDDNLNCKLCDFGFAKMGFSSMVKMLPPNNRTMKTMMGSPGYTDPHYLRTGIASKKNDVYSFGVLLLELVTGKEAFCSKTGQLLTSLVDPMLGDMETRKLVAAELMVDQRLAMSGDFEVEEARALLSISALCLQQSAALRPCASQILQIMKTNISSISFLLESSSHKI